MFERIRNYIRGGEKVQEARSTIDRLGNHPHLSPENRDILNQAKRETRRHFVTVTTPAAIATLGVAAAGVWGITELIPDGDTKDEKLRKQIKNYEEFYKDTVNEKTVNDLLSYTFHLYKATFQKEPLNWRLVVIDYEMAKNEGFEIDEPTGNAGLLTFAFDQAGTPVEVLPDIPIFIFTGDENIKDPSMNRLSVIRGLIMHEFIHAQTKPTLEQNKVRVGNEEFQALVRRGLNYAHADGEEDLDRGHIFDEINTQFLAEYMNDPTGKDPLFRQMATSDVYRFSLEPSFVEGASLLKRLYPKLGISAQDVSTYYYEAQPKELAERIDASLVEIGAIKPNEFTQIFFSKVENGGEDTPKTDGTNDKKTIQKLDFLHQLVEYLER